METEVTVKIAKEHHELFLTYSKLSGIKLKNILLSAHENYVHDVVLDEIKRLTKIATERAARKTRTA